MWQLGIDKDAPGSFSVAYLGAMKSPSTPGSARRFGRETGECLPAMILAAMAAFAAAVGLIISPLDAWLLLLGAFIGGITIGAIYESYEARLGDGDDASAEVRGTVAGVAFLAAAIGLAALSGVAGVIALASSGAILSAIPGMLAGTPMKPTWK